MKTARSRSYDASAVACDLADESVLAPDIATTGHIK